MILYLPFDRYEDLHGKRRRPVRNTGPVSESTLQSHRTECGEVVKNDEPEKSLQQRLIPARNAAMQGEGTYHLFIGSAFNAGLDPFESGFYVTSPGART
jgi:hypothetical protein